jgi:hypothetical protein
MPTQQAALQETGFGFRPDVAFRCPLQRNGRLGHVTAHLPADRHLPRVDVQAQFDFLPAPLASPVADSFNLRRVHDRQLTPPSHVISRSVESTRLGDCQPPQSLISSKSRRALAASAPVYECCKP